MRARSSGYGLLELGEGVLEGSRAAGRSPSAGASSPRQRAAPRRPSGLPSCRALASYCSRYGRRARARRVRRASRSRRPRRGASGRLARLRAGAREARAGTRGLRQVSERELEAAQHAEDEDDEDLVRDRRGCRARPQPTRGFSTSPRSVSASALTRPSRPCVSALSRVSPSRGRGGVNVPAAAEEWSSACSPAAGHPLEHLTGTSRMTIRVASSRGHRAKALPPASPSIARGSVDLALPDHEPVAGDRAGSARSPAEAPGVSSISTPRSSRPGVTSAAQVSA